MPAQGSEDRRCFHGVSRAVVPAPPAACADGILRRYPRGKGPRWRRRAVIPAVRGSLEPQQPAARSREHVAEPLLPARNRRGARSA